MKILKRQQMSIQSQDEQVFRETFQNSPLARTLKDHIDKYYPKQELVNMSETVNATS